MNDILTLKKIKQTCLEELRDYIPRVRATLDSVDPRLYLYMLDAIRSDIDTSNIYELAGIRKVLRLMCTYEINIARARQWIVAIEGKWQHGKYQGGGLAYDTPRGHKHVPLMAYQIYCLFGMYGFDTEVCMERQHTPDTELLPTEFVRDGMVYDKRRLCTEAHIFQTRKSGKTEFGASVDFVEANALGPANAQVAIIANSRSQAIDIAFKAVKQFAYQLDPKSVKKSGGDFLMCKANELSWKPGYARTSEILAVPAGGKPKDGYNATHVHADEHGQASYIKGNSDMENTVQVFIGSMGVRRERMVMHTTTAGLVNEGPYQLTLRRVEDMLLKEMEIPLGTALKTPEDSWFAFLLRLDPWDYTGNIEDLNRPNLWRKVNRSIGITVQPTWYRDRIHDALTKTEDIRREVLTKDFNIWQSSRKVDWIKPEDVRRLQVPKRIDDCTADEGWRVFVGLDFSMGDDLHSMSYLAFREAEDGSTEFFADMDAWISSKTFAETSIKTLYEKWVEAKHLHVSPGAVLQPELPVERIAELFDKGVIFMGFGYDPYKAKTPINALAAWVVETTGNTAAPKDYIVPVRQNYASYNPVVEELDFMLKNDPPLISFSDNPMWPWEAGNIALDVSTDGMENKKMVKNSDSEACKVDNWQCLASALMLYDRADGRESD